MRRSLALLLCILLSSFGALANDEEAPDDPKAPAARGRATEGLSTQEVGTRHFRIVYTEGAKGAALELATRIESMRDDFQRILGRDWPGVTEVRMGLGRTDLEALARPGGAPPTWAEAFAYPDQNVVVVDARSLVDTSGFRTLRHELTHVALGALGGPWPRWFQEGLATRLAGERRYSLEHYTTMFRALRQERLFAFEDLDTRWPEHPSDVEIAYAQSADFVSRLLDREGPEALAALLDRVATGETFESAFRQVFRSTVFAEQERWKKELPKYYSWIPVLANGTTAWALAAGLCVAAFLRYRSAVARRRSELALEEAAEDAALRILAAEAAQAQEEPTSELSSQPAPTKPTLH